MSIPFRIALSATRRKSFFQRYVYIVMISEMAIRTGSTIAHLVLYKLCPPGVLGPGAEYWDAVRHQSVGLASSLFGRLAHTDRPIRETEFVGHIPKDPDAVERLLWKQGFERNPIPAVKMRDGTPEIGSWVRRENPTDRRQLHVMLFESEDSGVDVYAHEEFSAVNPTVAVRHYRGIDQREALGVKQARETLPVTIQQEGDTEGNNA